VDGLGQHGLGLGSRARSEGAGPAAQDGLAVRGQRRLPRFLPTEDHLREHGHDPTQQVTLDAMKKQDSCLRAL
jgi:hypothetical protein